MRSYVYFQEAEDEREDTCPQNLAEELGHASLPPASLRSKVTGRRVEREIIVAREHTLIYYRSVIRHYQLAIISVRLKNRVRCILYSSVPFGK